MSGSKSSSALAFLGWVLLCFAAAATGSLWPPGEWYAGLSKPSWTPPGWLFGPVWTALYFAMAVAVWRVGRAGWSGKRASLVAFLAQWALNASWTPVFFGLRVPGLGLIVIIALWIAIAATIAAFARHDRVAAGLLVPYLAWVGFAAALNFELWRLNPGT